jgi:hypothetical protein
MRTVFADTFYFLALLSPSDLTHAKAVQFTSADAVRMITTEWNRLGRPVVGQSEF